MLTLRPSQTVRCTLCEHEKPASEIRWLQPFGAARPSRDDNTLDTFVTPARSDDPNALPYCLTCLDEIEKNAPA